MYGFSEILVGLALIFIDAVIIILEKSSTRQRLLKKKREWSDHKGKKKDYWRGQKQEKRELTRVVWCGVV